MNRRQSWSRREFLINTGVAAASLCIPGFGRAALGNADAPNQLVLNPYTDIDWSTIGQYKAALHMHTLQSDGYQPVADYKTSDRPWPLGRVVHVGPTLPYRTTPGIGTYVRAELVRREGNHTHRTFANPFGFSDS